MATGWILSTCTLEGAAPATAKTKAKINYIQPIQKNKPQINWKSSSDLDEEVLP